MSRYVYAHAADDLPTIPASAILDLLAAMDVPAFAQNSGGNIATIYAGKPYEDENGDRRYPVLAGPGRWIGPDEYEFDTAEIYVGPDDDGDTEPLALRPIHLDGILPVNDDDGLPERWEVPNAMDVAVAIAGYVLAFDAGLTS